MVRARANKRYTPTSKEQGQLWRRGTTYTFPAGSKKPEKTGDLIEKAGEKAGKYYNGNKNAVT